MHGKGQDTHGEGWDTHGEGAHIQQEAKYLPGTRYEPHNSSWAEDRKQEVFLLEAFHP